MQALNYPDRYVRHRNFKLYLKRNDNSKQFKLDSSFIARRGFTATQDTFAFESVNMRGKYIRHSGYRLRISNRAKSNVYFKGDASWKVIMGEYLTSFLCAPSTSQLF